MKEIVQYISPLEEAKRGHGACIYVLYTGRGGCAGDVVYVHRYLHGVAQF